MGVNKVTLNDPVTGEEVVLDLTGDPIKPEHLDEGITAHDASGEPIEGTRKAGDTSVVDSGAFGENLTWTVYSDGRFVVKGTGSTYDFGTDTPCRLYNDIITAIIIEDGVTRIGDRACQSIHNVEKIEIPETVTEISTFAFVNASIRSIVIPKSIVKLAPSAFYYCTKLETIYYGGTKEEWDSIEYDDFVPEEFLNATLCCIYDPNADTVDGWHLDVRLDGSEPPEGITDTISLIITVGG